MRPILVRLALVLSLAVCAVTSPASAAVENIFALHEGMRCVHDELAGMVCVEVPRPWYRGAWVPYAAAIVAAVTLAGACLVTACAHPWERVKRAAFPVCAAFWLLAGLVALVA